MITYFNFRKKHIINETIQVGQRFIIYGKPITCVHIDGNKRIYSMDDIYKLSSYEDIESVLRKIWNTGIIDGIRILPLSLIKDIDFLFIPNSYQIFGTDVYNREEINENIEQFDWFKHKTNEIQKSYYGKPSNYVKKAEICPYWIEKSNRNSDFCFFVYNGIIDKVFKNSERAKEIGIPIFFQMTEQTRYMNDYSFDFDLF